MARTRWRNGLAQRRRALDPRRLEEEPGAGGEARCCGSSRGDGTARPPARNAATARFSGRAPDVLRHAGKAELHVVPRPLAHHVTADRARDRRRGPRAPGGRPPAGSTALQAAFFASPSGLTCGTTYQVAIRSARVVRRPRGQQGNQPAQHRRPHRLIGVAAADQADMEGTGAEPPAGDLAAFARTPEDPAAGRRRGVLGRKNLFDREGIHRGSVRSSPVSSRQRPSASSSSQRSERGRESDDLGGRGARGAVASDPA